MMYLSQSCQKIQQDEEWRGNSESLDSAGGADEDEVTRDGEEDEHSRHPGIVETSSSPSTVRHASTERGAWEDTDTVIIRRKHSEQRVGGFVEIGGHPGGLYCHEITSSTIHHRGEHGDTFEVFHSLLQDHSSTRADQHCQQDWSPASAENQTSVLVLVRQVEEEGEDSEVDDDDDEGGVTAVHHVSVEEVADPSQQTQGGHVTQRSSDGSGHIVRVTLEPPGQEDDHDHDQSQDQAGDGGGDHGTGHEQQRVISVDLVLLGYPGHHHPDNGGEEPDHDPLALDQDQVTQDHVHSH